MTTVVELVNETDPASFSSSFADQEEEEVNFSDHTLTTIVLLSLVYGLLSLTACVGNLVVIWIIATGRRMRTVMNVYIGNLALADVIIAVLYIPFQFQAALLHRWDLPAFMCKLCPFIQHLSINASIFTLVVIALDRYRGIIWPLKRGYSKCRAKIILFWIWLLSLTPALPNLFVFHVIDHPSSKGAKGCDTNYDIISELKWRHYTLTMVLIQYLVPLTILIISYGHMAEVLWTMTTPGQANARRDSAILANKKKVIKMLSIVVALFGICWLPFQTFNFLVSLKFDFSFRGVNYIWMASHILAMSNSCCNPFIYGAYNEKFRRELKRKMGAVIGMRENRNGTVRRGGGGRARASRRKRLTCFGRPPTYEVPIEDIDAVDNQIPLAVLAERSSGKLLARDGKRKSVKHLNRDVFECQKEKCRHSMLAVGKHHRRREKQGDSSTTSSNATNEKTNYKRALLSSRQLSFSETDMKRLVGLKQEYFYRSRPRQRSFESGLSVRALSSGDRASSYV